MAPFSKEPWDQLARSAKALGVQFTVLVDGLNECPADLLGELMQQLRALLLRYPADVLVTTKESQGVAGLSEAVTLVPTVPNALTRGKILALYEIKRPDRISVQFRTPYELSIAAKCESELSDQSISRTCTMRTFVSSLRPSRCGPDSVQSRFAYTSSSGRVWGYGN